MPSPAADAASGADHHLPAAAPRDGAAPEPGRRHCFVTGPAEAPGPHPGLVLEWRHQPDGQWLGYVVYVVVAEETLVQQWVPAHLLEPL